MLVLTRTIGSKIYVEHGGETLEISFLAFKSNQLRIAFDGSKSFNIQRDNAVKIVHKPQAKHEQ